MRSISAALFLAVLAAAPASAATVSSPDGHITVRVSIKDKLEPNPPGPRVYSSVALDGRDLLLDSPLALDFKDARPFARSVRIAAERTRAIDDTWETVVGKSKTVRDRANGLTVSVVESELPMRHAELVFRAYDDGVASGGGCLHRKRSASSRWRPNAPSSVRGEPHGMGRAVRQLHDIAGGRVQQDHVEPALAQRNRGPPDAGEGERHGVGGADQGRPR